MVLLQVELGSIVPLTTGEFVPPDKTIESQKPDHTSQFISA
jgi:hypothetical protein